MSTSLPNLKRPPARQWLTIEAAAEVYSCSPKTIRRMISRGEIDAYRLGKRMLRVDRAEIDSALRPIPTAGDAS